MKKEKSLKKKIKKGNAIIIIAAVVLVGTGGVIGVKSIAASAAAAASEIADTMVETAAIEKRTLVKSISATGVVEGVDSRNESTSIVNQEISDVHVKVGDLVKPGDLICSINLEETKESLSDATKSLEVMEGQNELSVKGAERQLQAAKDSQITDAKAADENVAAAQKDTDRAKQEKTRLENELNSAKALEAAKKTEGAALEEIQAVTQERKALEAQVLAAQTAVETAERAYGMAVAARETTNRNNANAVISQEENLTNIKLGITTSTDTQKRQAEKLMSDMNKGNITASIGGTVTALNFKAGDLYTGGTIATIEDTSSYMIATEIGEYDISDLSVGMKVLIKTDATRDEELEGTISFIAPTTTKTVADAMAMSAYGSSSTATYKVKVSLDTPNDRLRLGMNARLSIILDSRDNVYAVPYDAVERKDDGTAVIRVIKDGKQETEQEIEVQVGMESNYYVEVISDKITDNMSVILPVIEDSSTYEDMMITQ